jgi:hypothetical protein
MANRWGRSSIVLLIAMFAGCQTTPIQGPGQARILTGLEMDAVTAGLAISANDAAARALGAAPQAAVLGIASAYTGNSPIAGAPLLNYAKSQATASANGSELAQTGLSSRVSVGGVNAGASIDAKAAGGGTSGAQITAQFYGISTSPADLAFGSVSASACCGSATTVQVKADSGAGGPYSQEIRSTATTDVHGQAQRRVDIAVVSSALPILDPAQLSVTGGPARISPKY